MDYEEIVDRNLDIIYRVAFSYCKHPQDAEDVTQNTFAKLLQTKEVFRDEEHIRKWLIRVAINDCKNLWKSFQRRNVTSLEDLGYEPAAGEDTGNRELLEAVMALPPKYRIVIHLYYYEGFNAKEIGEMLHISESNVQNRLMRGRQKLKEWLKEA